MEETVLESNSNFKWEVSHGGCEKRGKNQSRRVKRKWGGKRKGREKEGWTFGAYTIFNVPRKKEATGNNKSENFLNPFGGKFGGKKQKKKGLQMSE